MANNRNLRCCTAALVCMSLTALQPTTAAEWSNTEFHVQYGNLTIPDFAGGGKAKHLIYTLQHASGWKYGDNFFFVDVIDSRDPGFQDFDMYGEFYPNFSLGKITGNEVGAGPIKDVGLQMGFNWAADAKVKKYLPGVSLTLDFPKFAFARFSIAAYLDASEGASAGGAPKEDDTFLLDFSWIYPFKIGEASFSVEGHVEYAGERTNEFGDTVEAWILGQPQFRYNVNDHLALGFEWQFWLNKLGEKNTDENALQLLLVWKF